MELAESDELTEFTADELSAVIRDDGGSSIGKRLSCLLDDDLGVSGPHGGKEFPGHGIAAVSVDNAAHVVEGTRDLDVSEVDVPVLVGFGRLLETIASPGVGWRWPGQLHFLTKANIRLRGRPGEVGGRRFLSMPTAHLVIAKIRYLECSAAKLCDDPNVTVGDLGRPTGTHCGR
ncbi:MAG: hypothetical protein KatS3mg110_4435 [Pirellulaceae bacterium]|nr:MAG: hypothetical protein KatS3mg110_4435 [Pirellulaceae bacterium]